MSSEAARRAGRPLKYPVAVLAVGEWLDLPLSGQSSPIGRDRAAYVLKNAADRCARLHGRRFTVRTMRGEGVARCTRIA